MSSYTIAANSYFVTLYHAMLSIALFSGMLVFGWYTIPVLFGNRAFIRWVYLACCGACYMVLAVSFWG